MTKITGDEHIATETTPSAETTIQSTFEEPKLSFIEPKLTKQGDATKITKQQGNGFFGTFPL